jgi:O-antigen/teichoic acid export membrane protein
LARSVKSPRTTNPLPEGTIEVGVGLVIAGLTTYAYLTVAKAALGKSAYGPLGVLWAVIFTAGPGFFLPIEQEVSRALAARRSRQQGAGPLLRRAATLGGGLLVILLVVCLAAGPVLVAELFSDQWLLLLGLLLGLVGYYMGHLTRGTVSGLGRFRPYSVYLGGEGVVRLAGCLVLAVVGVKTAGMYGVVLGIAPIVAALAAMRGQRDVFTPGPDAPYSELSASLGALLAASVLAQGLVNAGVVAVKVLASGPREDEIVATFFVGVVVARLPLFLFQAVQAALLPKLTELATTGQELEFRRNFRRLMAVVAGVGVVGVLAVAQALIALHGQNQVAVSWLGSIVVFVAGLVVFSPLALYTRIELAMVAGAATALLAMTICVIIRVRAGAVVAEADLIEALHDVTLEP